MKFYLAGDTNALESARMQRWIYIGIVVCLILGSAMVFALFHMRGNRPESRWVPIAVRSEVSLEEREKMVEIIQQHLTSDESLKKFVSELQLQTRFPTASEGEAMKKLKEMIFVRVGVYADLETAIEHDTIDIGVNGKRREVNLLSDIAVRIGSEVRNEIAPNQK